MAIENFTPTSMPGVLNVDWPLASDPPSEGDNHLRGVKQVIVNTYAAHTALEGRTKALEDKAYLSLGPEQSTARHAKFAEAVNLVPPGCVITRSDTFITGSLTEYVIYYRKLS